MANNARRLHKQVREGGNKTHTNISIIYWTSRDCYSNHIANLGQEEADKEGSLRQEFPGQPHCKCWKGNRADEAVPRGLLTSAFSTRLHPTCQSLHCKIFGKISRWCFCAVLNTEETKQNPTQRLLPGKRAGMHVRTHIVVRGVLHPCVSFNQGVLPHHFSQVYGRCLWKEINAWHGPEIFGLCMCVCENGDCECESARLSERELMADKPDCSLMQVPASLTYEWYIGLQSVSKLHTEIK